MKEVVVGCSKCRYCFNGCRTCRTAAGLHLSAEGTLELLKPGPGEVFPKLFRRSGPSRSRKRNKAAKKKPQQIRRLDNSLDSFALPDAQLPAYCTQPTSKRQKLAAWQPSAGGQKEGSQDSEGSLVDLAVPHTATGHLQDGPAVGAMYRLPSTERARDSAAALPSGLQLHMPQTPPGHPGAALAATRRLEQAQPSAGLPSGKCQQAAKVSGRRNANANPADDKPQRQRRNAAVQCQQRNSDIAALESSIDSKRDIGMGVGHRDASSWQLTRSHPGEPERVRRLNGARRAKGEFQNRLPARPESMDALPLNQSNFLENLQSNAAAAPLVRAPWASAFDRLCQQLPTALPMEWAQPRQLPAGTVPPPQPGAAELLTAPGHEAEPAATDLSTTALEEHLSSCPGTCRIPALCSHPGAVRAHQTIVQHYRQRKLEAQRYSNHSALQGRNLDGFASRCGALAHPGAMRVQIGCGTGLADVHYHCHHCYADPGSDPGDQDPDSDQDASLDYCAACVAANDGNCPNPRCLSRSHVMPLVPQDFLANRKGMRDFAAASQQVATKYSSRAEAAARLSHSLLKGALQGLPEACLAQQEAATPMYVADPATLAAHRLFENGLDEGVPVLVKAAAQVFDNTVFTPAAMQALAIEDHHLSGSKVKAQFNDPGGATTVAEDTSIEGFFAPMLRDLWTCQPDTLEGDGHVGFKLPDFGLQPVAQSEAFMSGLYRLGVGEIAAFDGQHNLACCLRSMDEDAINGTQVPDLGPKFYIARPLLMRFDNADWQTGYQGFTFTPLHCDLADAVNYSCFGEAALWQIFRRDDRKRLMEFLGDKYGARRKRGEDMLWNQANHRLLEEDDLDELAQNYGIRPWQFVQREGELVVIPAGCAHQVRNGGRGHNIKVAQDFIAPHSASICLELLEEMRVAHQEDKLQAVLTLQFAAAEAWARRRWWEEPLQQETPDLPVEGESALDDLTER